MRNLAFTSDSPQSIKLGDSNDVLSLRVTEFDQPVDLSKVQSIEVKIGNANGYLKSIDITAASLLHPTDGRIDVTFTNDNLSDLPAGNYLIEVWIIDSTGDTTIYPDSAYPDVIGFAIDQNIMSSQSSVITTITLADFENKFDDLQKDLQDKATDGEFDGKAATVKVGTVNTGAAGTSATITNSGTDNDAVLDFTIPKGDAGTVDNAGLTAAPAFVALQTQVDNSAIGTNLLTGTSATSTNVSTTNWGVSAFNNKSSLLLNAGTTYTAQAVIESCTTSVVLTAGYVDKSSIAHTLCTSNTITGYGKATLTLTIPTLSDLLYFYVQTSFSSPVFVTESYKYKNMKLEKGSVATDWCPNPAEVLTQSDYAKIQAAIVALGGSL